MEDTLDLLFTFNYWKTFEAFSKSILADNSDDLMLGIAPFA